MKKIFIGRDCACGCGRKTDVGLYASWHIKNGISELQQPCTCGCGQLTNGKVNVHTREPNRFVQAHGATMARRAGKRLCICGCGRVAMKNSQYSQEHIYEPLEELIHPCRCGCGGLTSGKVAIRDGLPVEFIGHHSLTNRNAKLCICGCGERTTIGDYAHWHSKRGIDSLKMECACGCGEMTSGKVDDHTHLPVTHVWRHAAKPYKNGEGPEHRTNLEAMVEGVLQKLGIPYIFDEKVGPYWPDFQLPGRKIILEADGDYWHREPRKNAASRDSYFAKRGWKIRRLSETAIRENVEAAVLKALD